MPETRCCAGAGPAGRDRSHGRRGWSRNPTTTGSRCCCDATRTTSRTSSAPRSAMSRCRGPGPASTAALEEDDDRDVMGYLPTGRTIEVRGVTIVSDRDGDPTFARFVDWVSALAELGIPLLGPAGRRRSRPGARPLAPPARRPAARPVGQVRPVSAPR